MLACSTCLTNHHVLSASFRHHFIFTLSYAFIGFTFIFHMKKLKLSEVKKIAESWQVKNLKLELSFM